MPADSRRHHVAAGLDAPYTVPVDLLLLYTRGPDLLVGLRQGGFASAEWDTPSVH